MICLFLALTDFILNSINKESGAFPLALKLTVAFSPPKIAMYFDSLFNSNGTGGENVVLICANRYTEETLCFQDE